MQYREKWAFSHFSLCNQTFWIGSWSKKEMKNEFVLAFNEVLEDKQLPREIIIKALESAMISAYRRAVNASSAQQVEAKINLDTGKVTIYAEKEVVDSVQDPRTEVTLAEAQQYNAETEIGSMVIVETTPHDFGRVAAQTARQVIQQRIRDAERQAQLAHYEKQLGEIISGVVQAINAQGLTIGLEMKAEGSMPRKEMIGGERFRLHDRVRMLVSEVKDSPRGPQIILSRTHRNFLRRLLETEVPEIYHGIVEIRSIAREPGERAKVAVAATQPGIDPVGACVGIRGVRIQAIVRELHDEKIDVIEWNSDPAVYIAKALSPARVVGVYLTDKTNVNKTASVVVPEDQLSLAIGRDGQNARLAAKLTGWRIDIKSLPEAATETLKKVQSDPLYTSLPQADQDVITRIEGLLARKAEGRPLTPEEYDQMGRFVDRVERKSAAKAAPEKKPEETARQMIAKTIPAWAFEQNILDSGLPDHVATILQGAGYLTTGDLVLQAKINPDDILRLQGIGPRSMMDITRLVETIRIPEAAELEPAPSSVAGAPAAEAVGEITPPVETAAPTTPEVSLPEGISEVIEAAPAVVVEQPAVSQEIAPTISDAVEKEVVTVAAPEEGEEEPSFDTLFTLRPEILEINSDTEEGEEDEGKKGKKKGKKKRKTVEIEYDPDRDMTIVHKKHKRGDWDWEE
jgi:N utilization substance protein A